MESQYQDVDSEERHRRANSWMREFDASDTQFDASGPHHGRANPEIEGSNSNERRSNRMSTQGTSSSHAKTQPLSPSAHENYLRKMQEEDAEGFSPEPEHIQPASESRRFQTPATIARRPESELKSSLPPMNPLSGYGGKPPAMDLSQVFNNTQLPTSPHIQMEVSDPSSDRPSPAMYYAVGHNGQINLSSPSRPRTNLKHNWTAQQEITRSDNEEEEEPLLDQSISRKRARLTTHPPPQLTQRDDTIEDDEEEAETQIESTSRRGRRITSIIATPDNAVRLKNASLAHRTESEVIAVADSQESPKNQSSLIGLPPAPRTDTDTAPRMFPIGSKEAVEESSLLPPPPPLQFSFHTSSPGLTSQPKEHSKAQTPFSPNANRQSVERSSPPLLDSGPTEERRSRTTTPMQDTDKENRNPKTPKQLGNTPNSRALDGATHASRGSSQYLTADSQNSESVESQSKNINEASPLPARVRTLTDIAAASEPSNSLEKELDDIRVTNTQDEEFGDFVRSSGSSPIAPSKKRRRLPQLKESPLKVAPQIARQSSPLLPPQPSANPPVKGGVTPKKITRESSPLSPPPGDEDEEEGDSDDEDQETGREEGEDPDGFKVPLVSPLKKRKQMQYSVKSRKKVPLKAIRERKSPPQGSTEPSNLCPSPEASSFPFRVLAKFRGGTNAYYPATVLQAHGTSHVKIQFDDGTNDMLETSHMRLLCLRPGDSVKVDAPKMRQKNYVVFALRDQVNSEEQESFVTTSGHKTLLLAQRSRDSGTDLASLADASKVTVPVASIYVAPSNLVRFDDRPYHHPPLEGIDDSRPAPQTPTSRATLSAATTPSSRGRGRSRFSALPSLLLEQSRSVSVRPAQNSPTGLLSNMAFALSYTDEILKIKIADLVTGNGGTILESGFEELFARPATKSGALVPTSESKKLGLVALLGDRHSRKPKFMQALALGLPCLSGRWVQHSMAKGALIGLDGYMIAAGESRVLDGATISRSLNTSKDEMSFMSMVRRQSLIERPAVFVSGRKDAKRHTYLFLVKCMMGIEAGEIKTVEKLEDAAIDDGVLLVADKVGKEARAMLTRHGKDDSVVIVEDEDILQSLILGRLVDSQL